MRRREVSTVGGARRLLQLLAGAAGAVLFVMGIVAIFRIDTAAPLLDTTTAVAGFGFSAVTAVAAILLGGATMAAALADQDRGGTAMVGLLTVLAGIVALFVEGQVPERVGVERDSALLFVGVGAAVFLLSMVPWWRRRRVVIDEPRV
jgi:hypothetical protein